MLLNRNILRIALIVTTGFTIFFLANRFELKIRRKNPKLEASKEQVMAFYNSFRISEKKVYSQNGEDGVLLKLIDFVGISRKNGTYVEYATNNHYSNLQFLLRNNNFWILIIY